MENRSENRKHECQKRRCAVRHPFSSLFSNFPARTRGRGAFKFYEACARLAAGINFCGGSQMKRKQILLMFPLFICCLPGAGRFLVFHLCRRHRCFLKHFAVNFHICCADLNKNTSSLSPMGFYCVSCSVFALRLSASL